MLAAHGSVTTECANKPLFDLADAIKQHEIFQQVTPAFLYGQPMIKNVLDGLPVGDVVVVPVMTSEGYYTQRVFPKLLAENQSLDQHRLFLAPALGVHPDIPDMVAQRMAIMMLTLKMSPAQTTVVFIGHGTTKHPRSGRATMDLAAQVQRIAGEVGCAKTKFRVAFLDQPPLAETVCGRIRTPHTLIMPFLVSRGPHTTVDVPEAFGLPSGPQIEYPLVENRGGRKCVCDLPIGIYPEMADLCLEMATDQMMNGKQVDLRQATESSEAPGGAVA